MSDKLAGIAPGDRVRVTFEGEVTSATEVSVSFAIDGGDSRWFAKQSYTQPTFQIERIEPPLKAGDRVRIDGADTGRVLAVSDGLAWVRSDQGIHLSWVVESLERIA